MEDLRVYITMIVIIILAAVVTILKLAVQEYFFGSDNLQPLNDTLATNGTNEFQE